MNTTNFKNSFIFDRIAYDELDNELHENFNQQVQELMNKPTLEPRLRQAGQTLLALPTDEMLEVYTKIMYSFLQGYTEKQGGEYRPLFCTVGIKLETLYNKSINQILLKQIANLYNQHYHPPTSLIVANPKNDNKITSLAQTKVFVMETVYWVTKMLVTGEWQTANETYLEGLQNEFGVNHVDLTNKFNHTIGYSPTKGIANDDEKNRIVSTACLSLLSFDKEVIKPACKQYANMLQDGNFARLLLLQAEKSKLDFEIF